MPLGRVRHSLRLLKVSGELVRSTMKFDLVRRQCRSIRFASPSHNFRNSSPFRLRIAQHHQELADSKLHAEETTA